MSEMDEIVKEFLVESNEGLEQLDRDLVALERDRGSSDLLSSIFRAIHTIKGTSGVLGFPKIESVAHVGENLLSRMRDGKLCLSPDITSGLLAMGDVLRELLTDIESNGAEGERDVQTVIARLAGLLDPRTPSVPCVELASTAVSVAPKKRRPRKTPSCAALPPANSPAPPRETADHPESDARALAVSANNLRVDVSLLDKMMTLVGELVLARNQVLQFTSVRQDSSFTSTAQRLNLITTELQESVMKTRMQPIGNIWNKLPRLVRDLALSCGKRVRVEMDGADTELDKTIIEAIKDPITHIVRNAIDHGIEDPDTRKRRGKNEEGRLLLRAYHEGGQVNIEVSDDGRGIDLDAVRAKARDRNLVTADHAARITDRELLNLLFLPGFSTAQKVTNISGRGVGMDVVKTNIEKIGGTVDLQSSDKGATLKIKIPLTLAIIPALVATSGGERFAIPQVSLLELVRLDSENAARGVEHIHGVPVYRLRGNLLPLVSLNDVLGLEASAGESANIVVLQADNRQFGLMVDEINDTEEIVVKPLSNLLKGLQCFAGATIMGDGRVALILDVMGLAQQASVVAEAHDHSVKQVADRIEELKSNRAAWLLVRVGAEGRVAVPLSSVDRLEEFALSSIEHSDGHEVVQYRDRILPLVRLSRLLHLDASEPLDVLPVIVSSQAGRSVGLVVDAIEDVTEQRVVLNGGTGGNYRQGSAVLQHRVTDLLDVNAVIAAVGVEGREVAYA